MLNLSDWPRTEEGVGEILKSSITHFVVNGSKLEMVLGEGIGSKPFVHISGKGMTMIAMQCPNLLQLKLIHCYNIWPEGLREVVEKCV